MKKHLSLWLVILGATVVASCAKLHETESEAVYAESAPVEERMHESIEAPVYSSPPPPKLSARPSEATMPPPFIYNPSVGATAPAVGSVRPPIAISNNTSVSVPKETAAEAMDSWPFAGQLSKADIAFNAPDEMIMGETADMQLIIDPTKTSEEIKKEITAEGAKHGATVLISKIVIAKVIAPGFDVTELVNGGRQAIDFNGPTEWKWTISPKSKGAHKIHLTITAVIQIDGDKAERLIKSFDREIMVTVTSTQVITGFFEKYWQWLFSTLLLPLGLWLWKRRKKKED